MEILFVCTGNTCRSPMAEAILNKKKELYNLDVNVASAGIFAIEGQPPSKNAIRALDEIGIDISKKRAHIITEELVKNTDLILTMSKSHKEALINKYIFLQDRVYTLKDFTYKIEEDIVDPFGGTIEVYRFTRDEITKYINRLTQILLKK